MTVRDAPEGASPDMEALAALHASGFAPDARWTAAAIAGALGGRGAFLLEEAGGFLIGRAAGGEAELLTLVVAPARRRAGMARRLLASFEGQARARGAGAAFLEVAEGNAAARALYARAGWEEVGRRRGYYGGDDALILRRAL